MCAQQAVMAEGRYRRRRQRGYGFHRRQRGYGKVSDAFKRGAKWAWQKVRGRVGEAGRKALPKLLPVITAPSGSRKRMLVGIGKEFGKDLIQSGQGYGHRRYIRASW